MKVAKSKSSKKEGRDVGALKVKPKKERMNLEDSEWYRAKFLSAEVKTGGHGEYVRLQFEALDGVCEDGVTDATGTFISAMASYDLSIGTNFYDFVTGIMGKTLEEDDDCDLRTYYGDEFEVHVKTDQKTGSDRAYSNIDKIRVPKKAATSSKKKRRSAETEEEAPRRKKKRSSSSSSSSSSTGTKKRSSGKRKK